MLRRTFFHPESTRISKVVNKLTIFIVIECRDILKKSIYLIKLMPLTQKGVCCVCVCDIINVISGLL